MEHYPIKGKWWCVENLGLTEAQVRAKASRLGLRARGISEAWQQKQKDHAEILRGRKRPEQSKVMKQLHADGKLVKTDEQKAAISIRMKKWLAENEHPRGATGLKHTKETLAIMSMKSKESQAAMTPEQKAEKVLKMMKTKEAKGNLVIPRPHATWKAGWRNIGGINKYYRSRWEANYARYLEWLKSLGEIKDWKHEPKTFWFEGVKRGAVSYLPDFWVQENSGSEAYHEVKGWMDDRSKTKIKRMAKYHPDVKLIVIDGKAYRSIERKVKELIHGWE